MSRKVIDYTVLDEGRDQGKVFQIREMSASQAEMWAARAFFAMARNGIDIPDEIVDAGMVGIASFAIKAICGMTFDEARPLLDEMMACVKVMPDPNRPEVVRALIEDDIEEVRTRLKLRKEVFKLHTDFFFGASV